MRPTRVIDLNIIEHIRQDLFGNENAKFDDSIFDLTSFVKGAKLKEDIENPLNNVTVSPAGKPLKASKRVWLSSYNQFVYWQENKPVVRRNGSIVPVNKYVIDYSNGNIIFGKTFGRSLKSNDTITIDVKVPQLSVEDAYRTDISELNLPFILVERERGVNRPFELGNLGEAVHDYTVFIHTRNKGELEDYSDIFLTTMHSGVRRLFDYRKSLPLLESGALNPSFNLEDIETDYLIHFENTSDQKLRLDDPSDVEEHIGIVKFTAVTQFRR